MKDFKYELSRLPKSPGVYLMKDKEGTIIYVGKAKNLKNRVRSYFQKDSNKSMKVIKMVEKIDSFEYIIVENELEALVLESNFIKEHKPHYNILLRDDKQYPYIMVTNEKFPRIMKVRQVKNDKNFYFGPYPNAYAVNDTIDILQGIFKIRTCNLNFDKGARLKRPCLNYFIGRCPAPCVGKASEDDYNKNIDKVKSFLKGGQEEITSYLKDQMLFQSQKLNFEKAAEYRDYIKSIESLMERQRVTNVNGVNLDILAMYKKEKFVCIQVYFMRDGKLVDREHFIMDDNWDEDNKEIMTSFFKQFYLDTTYVPGQILVDTSPDDKEGLEELLRGKMARKVSIHKPLRGEKLSLVKMAQENAKKMLEEFLKKRDYREKNKNLGLKNLEKVLGIPSIDRIEAYDISNTSGVNSVGSMVVYLSGRKAKKEYRKFRIKDVQGPDDYASMEEVLRRRFKRYFSSDNRSSGFGQRPDLIIMDGGMGHVNLARKVLDDFGLDIEIVGLAKDDKHRTDALVYSNIEKKLERNSAIYRFLYDIQEEVHRFALDYHNSLRKSSITSSELLNIKGIGKRRMETLYKHFKTSQNIKRASIEDLEACPGISPALAQEIYEYFRRKA